MYKIWSGLAQWTFGWFDKRCGHHNLIYQSMKFNPSTVESCVKQWCLLGWISHKKNINSNKNGHFLKFRLVLVFVGFRLATPCLLRHFDTFTQRVWWLSLTVPVEITSPLRSWVFFVILADVVETHKMSTGTNTTDSVCENHRVQALILNRLRQTEIITTLMKTPVKLPLSN